MQYIFRTYEELSDFCCPFDSNLAKGITDEDLFYLLQYIERFYRQRLDQISDSLGVKRTNTLILSSSSSYLGRCHTDKSTIELDVALICFPPIVLTEVIIHELTHYAYPHHKKSFFDAMEKNVKKLGLEHILYGRDNIRGNSSRKYPTSIEKWYTYFDEYKRHGIHKYFRVGKEISVSFLETQLCSGIQENLEKAIRDNHDEQLVKLCNAINASIMAGINSSGEYNYYNKSREWHELVNTIYKYILPLWVDGNVYRTFSIRYHYGWYLIQTRRFKLAYEVMNQCLDSLKQLIQMDKKYNCYLSGVLKGIDEAKRFLH